MENSSRYSNRSTTLSEGIERAVEFSQLQERLSSNDASATSSFSARDVLRHSLSVKSVISSSSSFAERMNAARSHENQKFICIGRGSCGTIWEQPGTEDAFKTSPYSNALWVDFLLTNRVHNAFLRVQELMESTFTGITVPRVPKASRFFTPSNQWWNFNRGKFPLDDVPHDSSAAMRVHRVLPLPSHVREALIQMYFDPNDRARALADPQNKDCLVRLYFGENSKSRHSTWRTSLRNFELFLDMAQHLQLDVELITQEMAVSLAAIHWEGKCDGMDAEWVLGSAASVEFVAESDDIHDLNTMKDVEPDFKRRATYLWVLDFDKARRIEYDESCIPLLLGSVTANDPYLPNPKVSPKPLYQLLVRTYLQASEIILKPHSSRAEVLELPKKFIQAWEDWAKEPEDLGFDLDGWGGGSEGSEYGENEIDVNSNDESDGDTDSQDSVSENYEYYIEETGI